MAVAHTSSYMLDSAQFLLPSSDLWAQGQEFCSPEKFDPKTPIRDPAECDRKKVLTMTFINGTSSWIKIKGIMDCVVELLKKRYLCQSHEYVLENFRPRLSSIIQQYRRQLNTVDCNHTRMNDLVDQAVLCGVIHLKQVLHCHRCRVLQEFEDEVAVDSNTHIMKGRAVRKPTVQPHSGIKKKPNDIPGFRSDLCQPTQPATACSNDVDKSALCWEWLMSSRNHEVDGNGFCNHQTKRSKHRVPNELLSINVPATCDQTFDDLPQNCQLPVENPSHMPTYHSPASRSSSTRSSEKLQLEDSTDDIEQKDHASPLSRLPASDSSPRSYSEALTVLARCTSTPADQLPYHVSRRPSLRMGYRSDKLVSDSKATTDPGPNDLGRTACDQPTPARLGQQQQGDSLRHNLKTIHFLAACSPNMGLIPPPNHNPFATHEVL